MVYSLLTFILALELFIFISKANVYNAIMMRVLIQLII